MASASICDDLWSSVSSVFDANALPMHRKAQLMAASRQFELTADVVGVPAAEFELQVGASCWTSIFHLQSAAGRRPYFN